MHHDEAERYFGKAKHLYEERQYAAAISILDKLSAAFPDTENILLMKAHCLANLFRTIEAVKLCDRIAARCKSAKALDLKNRLVKNDGIPDLPDMDADMPMPELGIVLETPIWLKSSSAPQAARRVRRRWIALGVAVTLVVLLAAAYWLRIRM